MMPNQIVAESAVGAVRSTVRVASRRWFSFFRCHTTR
jgi:hypothetical protein